MDTTLKNEYIKAANHYKTLISRLNRLSPGRTGDKRYLIYIAALNYYKYKIS